MEYTNLDLTDLNRTDDDTPPAGCCRERQEPEPFAFVGELVNTAQPGDITAQQMTVLEAVRDVACTPGAPAAQYAGEQLVKLLGDLFDVSFPAPQRRAGGLLDAFMGSITLDDLKPCTAPPCPEPVDVAHGAPTGDTTPAYTADELNDDQDDDEPTPQDGR